MKNLLTRTGLAPAQDSSRAAKRFPAKRKLPPWLGLSLIMLLSGAVVFTGHCLYLTCDDCCRPDCSGGKGCGIYMVGIDANGFLWCGCAAADYPPCFFGGSCQTCPPDECPPGSNTDSDQGDWRGPLLQSKSAGAADMIAPCRSCGGAGGGSGGGGSSGLCGTPGWWVSEPNLTLWFKDTPLRYQPSRGPAVEFNLFCRNNWVGDLGAEAGTGVMACVGEHWSTPWLCYVKQDADIWTLYPGVASAIPFHGFSTSDDPLYVAGWLDYRQRFTTCMSNGYRVVQYVNGAQDVFGYAATNGVTRYFLTQRIDPHGNQLLFSYSQVDGVVYLDSLTDPDGHQVTFSFSAINGLPMITGVADSYGHSVTLGYDDQACLTSITDAAGLTSRFEYHYNSGFEVPCKLITPYGTNVFYSYNSGGTAVLVDEKGVGHHLYVYQDLDTQGRVPTSYANFVPSTTGATFSFPNTFDTEGMNQRNSYYWNPRQYDLLPAAFRSALEAGTYTPSLLTSTSFLLGRQRHWLVAAGVGQPISLERAASPDGALQGQITWYDYTGKADPTQLGSMIQPSIVAWKLPNGQSRFTCYLRSAVGHATSVIETYTGSAGDVRVRTNAIVYAANNLDVLSVTNAANIRVEYNVYNASHQVSASYDALGQLTSYTYDAYGRLTSVTRPSGLVTTNLYGADGYLAETRDIGVRTNYYTWANGLVHTHTDELGLTVTQTWDGLNRLIKTAYPDGTYITNVYQNLDLVQVNDRMGFSTRFEYNSLRQKTASIDALNRTSLYGYCNCGQLISSTDPLNETTTYTYDYAGRLIQTLYPDNYYVAYNLNLMGQATNTVDSGGSSVTNWYNNQGLLVASSNAFGQVSATVYDVLDRSTTSTDANGVSVVATYDNLNRVLTRTYPDNGVEKFGWSFNVSGLTSHTNQLNLVTRYGYDSAGRKTAETNANLEEIYYQYDPAGNLASLTDGKNHTTRWNYDPYGRVTNKVDQASATVLRYGYDANNRLTNRWSTAKGTTAYTYDNVGNLTFVNYPASPDVTLQYDPLNRVTNMVDAAGTTRYTFTTGGQLWTEDGPFASDTVTNTYQNQSRVSLSLQQPTGAWTNGFAYDAARRLTDVRSPAGAFTNVYATGVGGSSGFASRLIQRQLLANRSAITNHYDAVARLVATHLRTSAGVLTNKHEYLYNLAGQRTNETRMDGSTVAYRYDNLGQLKVADSSVSAEDRGYAYDLAWNLNYRTNNGSTTTFSVDSRNQLTSVGGAPDYYDGNGNLTNKATDAFGDHVAYAYDDENRLIDVQDLSVAYETIFIYDGLGRLRIRQEYQGPPPMSPLGGVPGPTAGLPLVNVVYYIYEGMRVIQERNSNNVPTVSYTRGTDLSGSLEGAGGIGGLLARSSGYSSGNWSTHNVYHADGNGNITFMLNSSQTMVASYRYDPFGNTISSSGSLASANTYRFSSKELHVNSGLYYYLYRFYDPNTQRWLNRDPLDELGFTLVTSGRQPIPTVDVDDDEPGNGSSTQPSRSTELNLYAFVENRPTTEVDPFGLLLGFGYGNWCGWSRSGPGDPIDAVDAACQKHDNCLATWADACKFKFCNVRFCKDVAKAKCRGDKACKKAKRKILAGCVLIVPIPPFIFM